MAKPKTADGYLAENLQLVRAACLYLATRLGDFIDDLVVIGGLVPSLLINQESLPEGVDGHVGTMDLDLGITIALLDEGRYKKLTERLREAGFSPDTNDDGNPTRQRWRFPAGGGKAFVDFLIPPTGPGDKGGRIKNIEKDFAAIIAPGLALAFVDRVKVVLKGETLTGEKAEREIWVCGAGAFVVLKALAFELRGEEKDAYDLYYVIRNFGEGPEDVAAKLAALDGPDVQRAVSILQRDFSSNDSIGPRRAATFIQGERDEEIEADVVGFVKMLLGTLSRL